MLGGAPGRGGMRRQQQQRKGGERAAARFASQPWFRLAVSSQSGVPAAGFMHGHWELASTSCQPPGGRAFGSGRACPSPRPPLARSSLSQPSMLLPQSAGLQWCGSPPAAGVARQIGGRNRRVSGRGARGSHRGGGSSTGAEGAAGGEGGRGKGGRRSKEGGPPPPAASREGGGQVIGQRKGSRAGCSAGLGSRRP